VHRIEVIGCVRGAAVERARGLDLVIAAEVIGGREVVERTRT